MRVQAKPLDVDVFTLLVHDTGSVRPFSSADVTDAINLRIEENLVGGPFRLVPPHDCGLGRWVVEVLDLNPHREAEESRALTRRLHSVGEAREYLPRDVVATLDAVASLVEVGLRDD